MSKLLYLLCLSFIKLSVIGSISEPSTISQSTVNESLLLKPDNGNEMDELALHKNDNKFSKNIQANGSESPEIPVDSLLEQVQNELDKSEDVDKTQYFDFITYLNKLLKEDTQKVKVLFKNVWRTVDLGLRGSSKRQRSALTAQNMLQRLKDLWKWLCQHIFSLTSWFKPNGSEKEIEHLNKLGHDEKMKILEKLSTDREAYYDSTNSKNPSDIEVDDSQVKRLK